MVKCFEAAGFDTLEVIAEMTIGNQPGNSIGKKFPPIHKIRIQRFVEEVKQNQSRKSQGKGKNGLFKGE